MKTLLTLLTLFSVTLAPLLAEPKVKAGPRNGRILVLEGSEAEFFVEANRRVSIAFYDPAGKRLPIAGQVVISTAEAPGGKVKLEFAPKGDLLVSQAALPAGEGYQIVVQARTTAEAKPRNFRIKLETHLCKECSKPEYACICNH